MSSIQSGLRMWQADDYPMLASWWAGHGWSPIPQRLLPPLGVIFEDSAAAWAYMDNGGTGVAMIEWIVTNPDKGVSAIKGLNHVIQFLIEELARLDYHIVISTCKQQSLSKFLIKKGFVRTDEGVIHHIRIHNKEGN